MKAGIVTKLHAIGTGVDVASGCTFDCRLCGARLLEDTGRVNEMPGFSGSASLTCLVWKIYLLLDNVMRACLHLIEDGTNILTNHAKKNKLDAGGGRHQNSKGGPSRGHIPLPEIDEQAIQCAREAKERKAET